jgi:hypothetical protein
MMEFLLYLLGLILGVVLGGYILLYGRRSLWATLGIVGLAATANLLAVLVAGVDTGRDLIYGQAWDLLGIALAVGVVGVVLGRFAPALAVLLIGFVAGADVALWLYDISAYLITAVAQLSEQIALWVGLGIILLGGLAGLWFVRKYRDEALILITMVLGTQLIILGLGISTRSSWTAIVALGLALFGVVRQYADYLSESEGDASRSAEDYQSPLGPPPLEPLEPIEPAG